jgi:hypothetical protein
MVDSFVNNMPDTIETAVNELKEKNSKYMNVNIDIFSDTDGYLNKINPIPNSLAYLINLKYINTDSAAAIKEKEICTVPIEIPKGMKNFQITAFNPSEPTTGSTAAYVSFNDGINYNYVFSDVPSKIAFPGTSMVVKICIKLVNIEENKGWGIQIW